MICDRALVTLQLHVDTHAGLVVHVGSSAHLIGQDERRELVAIHTAAPHPDDSVDDLLALLRPLILDHLDAIAVNADQQLELF